MSSIDQDEIIAKIQAKIAEQNEVIREQQIQIHDYQLKVEELEKRITEGSQAETARNELLSKLAELVD